MSTQIKLGDLEFKPEDFEGWNLATQQGCTHIDPGPCECIVKQANQLLRERISPLLAELEALRALRFDLEKAPVFYGTALAAIDFFDCFHPVKEPEDTYSCRIACIEKMVELKCDKDPYTLQKTLPGWKKD